MTQCLTLNAVITCMYLSLTLTIFKLVHLKMTLSLPYDSLTPITSWESKASPFLSAWTNFMALDCSLDFIVENIPSFQLSNINYTKKSISVTLHLKSDHNCFILFTTEKCYTFWTVIPSVRGLLLAPPPAFPCKFDSNVPKGLGR